MKGRSTLLIKVDVESVLILKSNFHQKAHYTKQTSFTMVFHSATRFTSQSTEAMVIKYLAQGHNTY